MTHLLDSNQLNILVWCPLRVDAFNFHVPVIFIPNETHLLDIYQNWYIGSNPFHFCAKEAVSLKQFLLTINDIILVDQLYPYSMAKD